MPSRTDKLPPVLRRGARALATAWAYLRNLVPLLRMALAKRRREREAFRRLCREQNLPTRRLLLPLTAEGRARNATIAQMRALSRHGDSMPTLLRLTPDEVEDEDCGVRTLEASGTRAVLDGHAPEYRRVTGAHVARVKNEAVGYAAGEKAFKAVTARVGERLEKITKKAAKLSEITVSRDEALMADAQILHDVRPRGAEVQKADTLVRGFWDANPNASEEVQKSVVTPIVAAQIRTIIEHLIKANPTIAGPPELAERARRWFEVELEYNSDFERGLDRFVTDLGKQMLYYGSFVLLRQRTLSPEVEPYKHPISGKLVPPVWGYAVPDMATMEVFLDSYGRPRRWRQQPHLFGTAQPKEYPARDVFMGRLPTQNSSLYFWTPPYVLPSLYAINVLRELHRTMERHTEALVDMPYYVQVGDKEFLTGQVTQTMIEDTRRAIDATPRGATLIVPWYVKINRVEAENYLEPLIKDAEFWGREVRRGIGGSSLTDGEGDSANRNTADTLTERDMQAAGALVPEIARAFRWLLWDKVFEWAASGEITFDLRQVKSIKDMPHLIFSEIDLAEQIRRETHALNLWLSGGISHKELRERIGEDPSGEYDDKFFFEIQQEMSEASSQQKLEGQMELVRTKMNPANQHGSAPKPKKRSNA